MFRRKIQIKLNTFFSINGKISSKRYSSNTNVQSLGRSLEPWVHPELSFSFARSTAHLEYRTIAQGFREVAERRKKKKKNIKKFIAKFLYKLQVN